MFDPHCLPQTAANYTISLSDLHKFHTIPPYDQSQSIGSQHNTKTKEHTQCSTSD
jgi:hypothetical protein